MNKFNHEIFAVGVASKFLKNHTLTLVAMYIQMGLFEIWALFANQNSGSILLCNIISNFSPKSYHQHFDECILQQSLLCLEHTAGISHIPMVGAGSTYFKVLLLLAAVATAGYCQWLPSSFSLGWGPGCKHSV